MRAVVAAAPNVDEETRAYFKDLLMRAVGGIEAPDSSIILVLTGGSEPEILDSHNRYNLLIATNSYNSLSAALEAGSALRGLGTYVKIELVRRSPDELGVEDLRGLIERFARIVRVIESLKRGLKIGVVGFPNRWLVSSNLDKVRIDWYPIDKALEDVERIDAKPDAEELVSGSEDSNFSPESLARPMALGRAVLDLASKRGWDAATIGCWCFDMNAVARIGWTPCPAVVRLNELGLPTACEGDLRAVVSMWMLASVSGRTAWMGNVNLVEGDVVVITHDGAPRTMLERYAIRPRMVTRLPAAIDGVYRRGSPVTLLRTDLSRAVLLRGVVTGSRLGLKACSSQLAVRLEGGSRSVTRHWLGNHLAFVLDDVYDDVRDVLEHLGIEVIS